MHTEFRPETYARLTAANAELTKTGIMLSRKATQRPWLVFTMGRHPITGKNCGTLSAHATLSSAIAKARTLEA